MSEFYSTILAFVLLAVGLLYIIASGAAMYAGISGVGGIGVGVGALFALRGFDQMEADTDE